MRKRCRNVRASSCPSAMLIRCTVFGRPATNCHCARTKRAGETSVLEIGHFIDGVRMAGRNGQFGEVFNPATGEVEAHVALASDEELETAVAAARRAQPSWAAQTPQL